MDWNNDGKHDYQDHAFYNNVVSPSEKDKSQGVSDIFALLTMAIRLKTLKTIKRTLNS